MGSTCRGRRRWGAGAAVAPLGDGHGCLHSIDIGLLLELPNIFLVANSLVTKPVGNLQGWAEGVRQNPFSRTPCPGVPPLPKAPERQ